MGADYSFYVKTIETYVRSFFKVIIFSIGSVKVDIFVIWFKMIFFDGFTLLEILKCCEK